MCRHISGVILFSVILSAGLVFGTETKPNLLTNSSFELGLGNWVGWETSREPWTLIGKYQPDIVDRTRAFHGQASLKIACSGRLQSEFVKLDPAKQYTLSFYAYSETKGNNISVALESGYRTGDGETYGVAVPTVITLNPSIPEGNWTRFSVSGPLPESPKGMYQVRIYHRGSAPAWVDAVKVEEGELSVYHPMKEIEVKPALADESSQDYLYVQGEKVPFEVYVSAPGLTGNKITTTFTLVNYYGDTIYRTSRELTVPEKGTVCWKLPVSPPETGILRAVVRANHGRAETSGDNTFGCTPKMHFSEQDRANSLFGYNGAATEKTIGTALKIGMESERLLDQGSGVTTWAQVEPEKNKWAWDAGDGYINLARKNNLSLLSTLFYMPEWAAKRDAAGKLVYEGRGPGRDINEWQEYVARTVEHFRGRVKYWEVWNEPFTPDSWRGTPEEYAEYLKAAYLIIKKIDPEAKVVGGCVAAGKTSFLGRLLAAGGLNFMDVLSYHRYMLDYTGNPKMPEESSPTWTECIRDLKKQMQEYGGPKPIWNTECGIFSDIYSNRLNGEDSPCTRIFTRLDPKSAAEYLTQIYAISLAEGVEKIFYYHPGYPEGYENERISNTLTESNTHPKPLALSHAVAAFFLTGAKPVKEIDWHELGKCYLFERNQAPVAVFWGLYTKDQDAVISIPVKKGMKFYNLMGNPRKAVPGPPDSMVMNLTNEPVYVTAGPGETRHLAEALAAAKISGLIPGKSLAVIKEIQPDLLKKVRFVEKLELGSRINGYLFEKKDKALAVIWADGLKKGTALSLPMVEDNWKFTDGMGDTVDAPLKNGLRIINLTSEPLFIEGAYPASRLSADFRKAELVGLDPVSCNTLNLVSQEGKSMFSAIIENDARTALNGVFSVVSAPRGLLDAGQKTVPFKNLPPGQQERFDFPLSDYSVLTEINPVAVEISAGGKMIDARKNIRVITAYPTKEPPVIDGRLDEWSERGAIRINKPDQAVIGRNNWKGPSDLSADLRVRYDRENLYLGIRVYDDVLVQHNRLGSVYNEDSVELYFDTDRSHHLGKKDYAIGSVQLEIAGNFDRHPFDEVYVPPYHAMSDVQMVSAKTPDGYLLEMRIPRKNFPEGEFMQGNYPRFKFSPGNVMGFDIGLNDADRKGEGRKTQMMWAGTSNNYCDVSNFGTLLFGE